MEKEDQPSLVILNEVKDLDPRVPGDKYRPNKEGS
jgi:hypothetical protein